MLDKDLSMRRLDDGQFKAYFRMRQGQLSRMTTIVINKHLFAVGYRNTIFWVRYVLACQGNCWKGAIETELNTNHELLPVNY